MTSRIIRIIVLVVIAVGLGYAVITLGKISTAAVVGDPAPDFTLEDMEGNMVSLSDYKGQFVILNFFASWCPPCRAEAPDLQKYEEKYGDQAKLLFLDRAEPKATVQAFIDEFQTTSTYVLDYNDSMARQYGVIGQPETFFIDEEGTIRYHYIGPMNFQFMVETINEFKKTPLINSGDDI